MCSVSFKKLSIDMEDIFLKPSQTLDAKTIMSLGKNKIDESTSRLDTSEEKISDFGGMAIEIIQVETGGKWFF